MQGSQDITDLLVLRIQGIVGHLVLKLTIEARGIELKYMNILSGDMILTKKKVQDMNTAKKLDQVPLLLKSPIKQDSGLISLSTTSQETNSGNSLTAATKINLQLVLHQQALTLTIHHQGVTHLLVTNLKKCLVPCTRVEAYISIPTLASTVMPM